MHEGWRKVEGETEGGGRENEGEREINKCLHVCTQFCQKLTQMWPRAHARYVIRCSPTIAGV